MKLASNTRLPKWLLFLLIGTLLLTLWMAFNASDEVPVDKIELADQVASSAAKELLKPNFVAKTSQINAEILPWAKLKRTPTQNKSYNLFKVHSWVVVPPVKKVKPEALPPPVAPPAPFIYVGKLEDTPKESKIFLLANGKLYSAKPGEKIDQLWRLDAEDVNALRLTYLPLNLPQVLSKSAKPLVVQAMPTDITEMNL